MLGVDDKMRLGKDIPDGRMLHEILFTAGCNLVEFLDNLAALQRPEFYFMCLPWKVRGMDKSGRRMIPGVRVPDDA